MGAPNPLGAHDMLHIYTCTLDCLIDGVRTFGGGSFAKEHFARMVTSDDKLDTLISNTPPWTVDV
jgi:hypothetical protein